MYVPPRSRRQHFASSQNDCVAQRESAFADAGHHSLAELAKEGETLVRRIGSGQRGLASGSATSAQFNEPNGLCLLPENIRAAVGYDVVVADTVNHSLRGIRLSDGHVRTLAGTGAQWMQGDPYRIAHFQICR